MHISVLLYTVLQQSAVLNMVYIQLGVQFLDQLPSSSQSATEAHDEQTQ